MKNNRQPSLNSLTAILGFTALLISLGCQTTRDDDAILKAIALTESEVLELREGDIIKITFPGATNFNSTQQIRRDGKITLEQVGELHAAGKTPPDLEKEIVELYSSKLVVKEVLVTVQSANFTVYVNGQVQRPGKVIVDHPMTALEAIMETGGFNDWADMTEVKVIRQMPGGLKHFNLNLTKVMNGKSNELFYLKPLDIIYVKRKIF